VGRESLAEVPAFKKALSGAANVAVGISKLGGSSAVISKVYIYVHLFTYMVIWFPVTIYVGFHV
jgi:hypothetical protein